MNYNRATSFKNKYSKYDYKTQIASHSYRSTSQSNSENQKFHKKQSRVKSKKKNSENSQITIDIPTFDCIRDPFSEIQPNAITMTLKKADRKKEDDNLGSINQDLRKRIDSRQKEINELKIALESMRGAIHNNQSRQLEQINNLRQANSILQKNFDEQVYQMNQLKKEFQSLRENIRTDKSQVTSLAISKIDQSKVSRRAEYTKNYQINAQLAYIQKCPKCCQHSEQIQAIRMRYCNELRILQEQINVLKKKEILLQVLEQQIQNKNNCIDYLRCDLQQFERKSNDLFRIVYTLENRLEERYESQRKVTRKASTPKWAEAKQPFQYILNNKY